MTTYAEMQAVDQAQDLDSLLARYHHWARGYKATRGFKSKALVVGDYLVSRQYDDLSGALDDDLEDFTMRTVDFQVNEMQEPYRTAIHMEARALNLGLDVFTSPRLPEDPAERRRIVQLARHQLTQRLESAGVM